MLDQTLAMQLSKYGLWCGLATVVLALICYTLVLVLRRAPVSEPAMARAGGHGGGGVATDELKPPVAPAQAGSLAQYGTYFSWLSLVFITGACSS